MISLGVNAVDEGGTGSSGGTVKVDDVIGPGYLDVGGNDNTIKFADKALIMFLGTFISCSYDNICVVFYQYYLKWTNNYIYHLIKTLLTTVVGDYIQA